MQIDRIEGECIYFKFSNLKHAQKFTPGVMIAAENAPDEISNFSAPELVRRFDFDEKVDVWAATVIVYLCLQQ